MLRRQVERERIALHLRLHVGVERQDQGDRRERKHVGAQDQRPLQAGADEAKVSSMIKDKVFEQYVVDATDAMSKNDVTATPTVFVDGKKIEGSPQDSVDAILKAIG